MFSLQKEYFTCLFVKFSLLLIHQFKIEPYENKLFITKQV